MTTCALSQRWPPAYDFDDLASQIKELAKRNFSDFYNGYPTREEFYQGDILSLDGCEFPFMNEDGEIHVETVSNMKWVLIGNSCDMVRDIQDIRFTNIAPLEEIQGHITESQLSALQSYNHYKVFYLPCEEGRSKGYIVDFTKMCSVEKSFLNKGDGVSKLSELNRHSWVLFNSCVLRYLARDDGRHD